MKNNNNIPNYNAYAGMDAANGTQQGMPQNAYAGVPAQTAVVPVSPAYVAPPVKKKSTVGYRLFAVFFSLLMIGGLFLGLLGKFVPLLGHSAILNQGTVLKGSLLGYLIAFFSNIVTFFKAFTQISGADDIVALAAELPLVFLVCFLAVSVVVSLIMAIVGAASGKAAKNCMHGNGILALISYGGIALYLFVSTFATGGFLASLDFPSLIVVGVVLIALFITTLAERKALGLFNIVLTIFSFAIIILFAFPLCALSTAPAGILMAELNKSQANIMSVLFPLIALAFTAVMILVSFYVTCSRVCAKRGYVGECVRYGLLLIGFVLIIAACMTGANKVNMFTGGALAITFTVLPVGICVLALVFAILAAVFTSRAKKKKKAAEAAAAAARNARPPYPPYGYQQPMAGGQQAPNGYRRNAPPPPQNANVPPRAIPPTAGANGQPMPQTGYAQRPVAPAAPIPPAGQPRPNGPMPPLRPNIPPNPAPQQGKPMTEFEKRMAAIAKNEQQPYPPQQPYPAGTTAAARPAGAPPPPPPPQDYNKRAARHAASSAAEKVENSIYNPSKYAYDPFVYTLTASEMNEFGDLFIANKYGLQAYLPSYVIGGDNRDFFNKVFIYLGRFRTNISDALLDKLYRFVCGM